MSAATPAISSSRPVVTVRAMRENDLPDADQIFRLAFGTYLGLPEPDQFARGADYIRSRFGATHVAGFTAVDGERLIGSNLALRWGSFGYFGPLTVHPEWWDRGVGQSLVAPVVDQFESWNCALSGLFTFSSSSKHVGLYQRFGYRPRHLTMIMSRDVQPDDGAALKKLRQVELLSKLSSSETETARSSCANLTGDLFEGLDLSGEISNVEARSLGETVLVRDRSSGDVAAFAVCHIGEGTEGGPGGMFVRFAAARNDAMAAQHFQRLMQACESLAASRGCDRFTFGINSGRTSAYEWLLDQGYRWMMQGVAMVRPNAPGFNRPDAWVLDDWR